jgi:23S rRNA pseudouridine1911/1915/1917 synthase
MSEPGRTQARELPVPDGLDGMRVDAGIARLLGLSRSAAAEIVDAGGVHVGGRAVGRSDRLLVGRWLAVEVPERADAPAIPPPIEVEGMVIVHDDSDIVVIDKPPGVAAHPSPGWEGPTVTQGLAAAGVRIATSGAAERQGVVHRLDAGTSGLMVVAKSERAYSELKRQFRDRTVHKRYRAIVQGRLDPLRGTIDAPIDRHPNSEWRFAVVAGGKPSVTHYDTIEAFRAASLVDVELETGRTHQIRVHMQALRHPLIGDTMYGADPVLSAKLKLTRQWLHAASLTIQHPADGRDVSFTSVDPPDLARVLDELQEPG